AFSERPQTKSGSGEFQPVTLTFTNPILPQHLTPEILNDWFRKNDWYNDVGEPVPTLEAEVARLKKFLLGDEPSPGEIAQAADAIAAEVKTEEARRAKLESLLLPLAYSTKQIDDLEKKIKQEPADKLDSLVKDAAQRRILVAILTPLEKYRPAEVKNRLLEQAADLNPETLTRLRNLLDQRMQATLEKDFVPALHFGGNEWDAKTRDTIEKRSAIAFLVSTIAHTQKPDGKLLLVNGPERAQVVLGLHEYGFAVQRLTAAMIASFERVLDSIVSDRDGATFLKNGKVERNPAFVDNYRAEVRKIQDLVAAIDKRQKRLDDLQGQIGEHKRIVDERDKQVKAVTDKLLKARAESFRQIQELKGLQKQFFDATKKLIDAQEQNLRREKELRHWESLNKKGGAGS
ncbi:MAG TPA: hypothetical protein VKE98_10270, partial [Gemmataceae bacterium]|nr:hypothetical protein [Gemmataceae bacterium]